MRWLGKGGSAPPSGSTVYIYSLATRQYALSNAKEGGPYAWSACSGGPLLANTAATQAACFAKKTNKKADLGWTIEYSGALQSGAVIYLKSNAVGSYWHSNSGESYGMSYGGKSSSYCWNVRPIRILLPAVLCSCC